MKKYLLLLILPILAFANIGKVTVVKGDVQIQRDSQVIKAKSGTILEKHDFVKTEKNGKVQIVFSDKTIFTVGKSSTLDIADYLYDEAQPKKNTAKFNVLKGAFSSITGRIGKLNKSKFKLKTKSASIGIRGTIVKANQEIIMCTEGAITVTTNNGVSVRVDAGQKTNVSSGTPTAPEAIKPEDEQTLDVEVEEPQVVETEAEATETIAAPTVEEIEEVEEVKQEDAKTEETTVVEQVVKTETEKVAKEVVETRSVNLQGRTIDSSGAMQTLNINAENVSGDLSLEHKGMTVTDDTGTAIDTVEDETISWGHWQSDPNKKWVAGQQTGVEVLDSLKNQTETTTNAQYNGKVMGSVNNLDDISEGVTDNVDQIKMDSTNQVQINFELGGGKNKMDGSMNFETESGQSWNSQFGAASDAVSGNAFQATSLSGKVDNTENIKGGGVQGNFYGSEAQSVGGTFQLNTDADKATGVFKATK